MDRGNGVWPPRGTAFYRCPKNPPDSSGGVGQRPKKFYLLSRSRVPKHIRSDLEDNGVTVIDGVGFNYKRIKQLAESLVKIAKKKSIKTRIGLSEETSEALRHLAQKLGLPESKLDEVIKILVRYALKNLSELKELFMEGKFDKGAKNPDK